MRARWLLALLFAVLPFLQTSAQIPAPLFLSATGPHQRCNFCARDANGRILSHGTMQLSRQAEAEARMPRTGSHRFTRTPAFHTATISLVAAMSFVGSPSTSTRSA